MEESKKKEIFSDNPKSICKMPELNLEQIRHAMSILFSLSRVCWKIIFTRIQNQKECLCTVYLKNVQFKFELNLNWVVIVVKEASARKYNEWYPSSRNVLSLFCIIYVHDFI